MLGVVAIIIFGFWVPQYIFEELAKENDSLKRLLLINHDFTSTIEEKIRELEKEDQERQMQKFRELRELQEKAEEKLKQGLEMSSARKDSENGENTALQI